MSRRELTDHEVHQIVREMQGKPPARLVHPDDATVEDLIAARRGDVVVTTAADPAADPQPEQPKALEDMTVEEHFQRIRRRNQ